MQNIGNASNLVMMPEVPVTSDAPMVTKFPVTCAVNRPCSARKPEVSTKPALTLRTAGSQDLVVMGPHMNSVRRLDSYHDARLVPGRHAPLYFGRDAITAL